MAETDLSYQGPVAAAQDLIDFREDFGDKLPGDQNTKLREMIRNTPGSPPKVMTGMEILYAIAVEAPPSTIASRKALHETLYKLAQSWGMGQWSGAEKTERAWAIQAWAAHQLTPGPQEPAQPDVDPTHTTLPPPVMDPAAAAAAPPAPAPAE